MPYDWKIELDSVDITDKVARFEIDADLAQYCRELTVEIADPAFYAGLDFATIPAAPALEVFTMTASTWVSQGKYFMERPALSSDINQDIINGLWGRGETARLGAPFAPRVSKMWDQDTSFFAICAEMCALAGLTWDDSQAAIDDFYIFAYTYQVENAYPVDVLSELAELAGALLTCDRLGRVLIRAIDYAPAAAAVTITDADWAAIQEAPEWPDFGNRVRIIPAGSLASYNVQVYAPSVCLPADGTSRAKIYAQVTDADGNPLDGGVVAWQTDASAAGLLYATSNTLETVMPPEEIKADNQHRFTLALPPASIVGVYAYADHARRHNLLVGGHSIDGSTVTLTTALTYCDQALRVYYTVAGVAINYLTAGSTAEDVTVTAEMDGQRGTAEIYVGNGCRCPASLKLDAVPRSIPINHTAQLIAYAEEGGGPITDGRLVRVWERTALGALSWTTARLGTVGIVNEPADAVNEIAGASQCTLSRFPLAGTIRVYRADIDGNPTGADIYSSHSGKIVDLSAALETGTELVAHYTARGAALNYFAAGGTASTAYFRASMVTNREAPLEAEASLQLTDPTDPTSGSTGDDYEGGGYGGSGGSDGELDTEWDFGCTLDDGSVVQCEDDPGDDWASHKTCCEKGGVAGCWPHSECDDSQPQFDCMPANVSDNPEATPNERFTGALETGCTCEESCQAELAAFGTTQGYDGGSYRTIEEIVAQDQGLSYVEGGDNADYYQAVQDETDSALADCLEACSAIALEWHPDNPDTINAPGAVTLFVRYGKGPFSWSVDGEPGWSLAAETTEGRGNTLTAAETEACGSATITVTDADGDSVSGSVRNVDDGQWALITFVRMFEGTAADQVDVAPPYGKDMKLTKIEGKYKLEENYFEVQHNYGTCLGEPPPPCGKLYAPTLPADPGDPILTPPDTTFCRAYMGSGASGDFPCCWQVTNPGYDPCMTTFGVQDWGDVRTYVVATQVLYEWVCE